MTRASALVTPTPLAELVALWVASAEVDPAPVTVAAPETTAADETRTAVNLSIDTTAP